MKQLLEAGVHFGQTRRWNLRWMNTSIRKETESLLTCRNLWVKQMKLTMQFQEVAQDGGTILFVGTKKQAQDAIKSKQNVVECFMLMKRQLGGMLISKQSEKNCSFKDIERMSEDGTFDVLPKKEVIEIKRMG